MPYVIYGRYIATAILIFVVPKFCHVWPTPRCSLHTSQVSGRKTATGQRQHVALYPPSSRRIFGQSSGPNTSFRCWTARHVNGVGVQSLNELCLTLTDVVYPSVGITRCCILVWPGHFGPKCECSRRGRHVPCPNDCWPIYRYRRTIPYNNVLSIKYNKYTNL